MKTKKLFAATLIAALAFTACSNDEETVDNSRGEVKIVATIDAPAGNRTKATMIDDGSGEFEAGDEFTLQSWNPVLSSGGGFRYEIGRTVLYWDEISEDGNPIDFYAWYPVYNFSGSFIHPYKVADAASEAAKDLLMTLPVTVAKYNQVNLQFKHVMHKLTVVLNSNYYSIDQLNSAEITLKNLKSDAMVDFNNGTVDETAASGTDPYPPVTNLRADFVVAPQTLTTGMEIIDIVIAGKTYSYEVPATLASLESGKILKITLNLTRYGVELLTGSISKWGNQGDISEEIEFN